MATTIEAVDAIQAALENEGVLQSIRAQLRASVYNIISKKSIGAVQTKVIEYMKKDDGIKTLEMVLDVLHMLNLKESLSVFQAETGLMFQSYRRNQLCEEFNLTPTLASPIIQSLLQAQQQNHSSSNTKQYQATAIHNTTITKKEDTYSDVDEDFEEVEDEPGLQPAAESSPVPSSPKHASPVHAAVTKDSKTEKETPETHANRMNYESDESFEQSEHDVKVPGIVEAQDESGPNTAPSVFSFGGNIAVGRHDVPSLQPIQRGAALSKSLPPLQSISAPLHKSPPTNAVDRAPKISVSKESPEASPSESPVPVVSAESPVAEVVEDDLEVPEPGAEIASPNVDEDSFARTNEDESLEMSNKKSILSSADHSSSADRGYDEPEHKDGAYSRRLRNLPESKSDSGPRSLFGATNKMKVEGKMGEGSDSDEDNESKATFGVQKYKATSSRSATGWGETKEEAPEDDDEIEEEDEGEEEDYSFLGTNEDALADMKKLQDLTNEDNYRQSENDVDDSFESESQKKAGNIGPGSPKSLSSRRAGDVPGSLAPRSFLETAAKPADTSFQSDLVAMEESDDDHVYNDDDNDDVLQGSRRSNQEDEDDYRQDHSKPPTLTSWGQRVAVPAPALTTNAVKENDDADDDVEIEEDALDKDYEDADVEFEDDYEFDDGDKSAPVKPAADTQPQSSLFAKSSAPRHVDAKHDNDDNNAYDYGEDDFENDGDDAHDGHQQEVTTSKVAPKKTASKQLVEDDDNDIVEEIESDVPEEDDLSVGGQESEGSDGFFGEGKSKSVPKKSESKSATSSWAAVKKQAEDSVDSDEEDLMQAPSSFSSASSSLFRSKSGSLPGISSKPEPAAVAVAVAPEVKKWSFPTNDDEDDDDDYFGEKKAATTAKSMPPAPTSSFRIETKSSTIDDDDAVEIMSGGSVVSDEEDVMEFSVGNHSDGNESEESDSYNFGDAKKQQAKSTSHKTPASHRPPAGDDADNSVSEYSVSEHEVTTSTSNMAQYDYSTTALPPKKSRW